MRHKRIIYTLLTFFFLQITIAQKLNAIDQKGTKVTVINNKVTTAATAPSSPNTNDVWYDSSTTPTTVKIYNGTAWLIMEHTGTKGSVFFAGADGVPTENNSELFVDNTPDKFKVGIGTNSPTNKLEVSGAIGAQGILNSDGLFREPSYRFKAEPGTGMFRAGTNQLGFSTNKLQAVLVDAAQQVNVIKNLRVGTGIVNIAGGITNTGTITNTGAINNSGLLTNNGGGSNTGGITNSGRIYNDSGAFDAPSYSFTGATTTGLFYRQDALGSLPIGLGFSVGGTEVFNSSINQVNFLKNIRLAGQLLDGTTGTAGTTGQVLTSTGLGTTWQTNTNWLISGNSGTTEDNFLGTIDDVKMSIRSKGLPMLEFGLRKTLDLIDVGRNDYTTEDQPLVYVGGDSITSALQFAASGAQFYKPMFFTTKNGSFRLKGSAGGTDLFEIGSAGPDNQGRLEFIVGDDGKEPMIFKRFEHKKNVHREFFRVQASDNGENTKTRFGININPDSVAISDSTLAYISVDKGLIANSTLQVNGSISNSTFTTTGALTLTEDHYAIILGGNHQITLPAASGSKGRIYIIKNPTNSSVSLSSSSPYLTNLNIASTIIASGVILWIQSDGTNWQQITGGNETVTTISNTVPVASGNLVGNFKNEANVTTGIYETVTSLTQSIGSSATGEITYKDEKGNSSKARVVSAVTNNQIKVGTDGGAYLGPTVYTGSFTISTATGPQTISSMPFKPSQVTFTAYANIDSANSNEPSVSGKNSNTFQNTFGGMQGYANEVSQAVIFVGGSANSINNISRYSSTSHCIGVRYTNQDGGSLGRTTATFTGFTATGFTINVDEYTGGLIVLYTAYK